MPIAIQCPGCGQPYNLNDRFAGQTVKCKQCGGPVQVPVATRQAPARKPVPQPRPDPLLANLGGPMRSPAPLAPLSSGQYKSKKSGGIPKTVTKIASFCLVAVLAIGTAYLRHVRRVQRRQAAAPPAAAAPSFLPAAPPPVASSPAAAPSPVNQGQPGPAAADSADGPEWTPDANALAKLVTVITFGEHTMRLPTGFVPKHSDRQNPDKLPGGGKVTFWNWVGPTLPGAERRVVIETEVCEPPATLDGPTYFDRTLAEELKYLRKSEIVHSVDTGRLGGNRTTRIIYSRPNGPWECIELHRFEGNRQVVVIASCPPAQRAEFFPLLEAAVLTVREVGEGGAAPLAQAAPAPQPAAKTEQASPAVPAVPAEGDTQIVGASGQMFREPVPEGSLLVGFEVGTEPGFGSEIIKAVRPIFRSAQGDETLGQEHGSDAKKVATAKAKEGYAVGGFIVKAGLLVDGFSIVFMRVKGETLDASDSYESEWFGGLGGNDKIKLGGDGSRVIAFIGRSNDKKCTGLGLSMKH